MKPFLDEKLTSILKKKKCILGHRGLSVSFFPGRRICTGDPALPQRNWLPLGNGRWASSATVLTGNSGQPSSLLLLLRRPCPYHQQSEWLYFQNTPMIRPLSVPALPRVAAPTPLSWLITNSLLNSLCQAGPPETHLLTSLHARLSVGMTLARLTQWVVRRGAPSERCLTPKEPGTGTASLSSSSLACSRPPRLWPLPTSAISPCASRHDSHVLFPNAFNSVKPSILWSVFDGCLSPPLTCRPDGTGCAPPHPCGDTYAARRAQCHTRRRYMKERERCPPC